MTRACANIVSNDSARARQLEVLIPVIGVIVMALVAKFSIYNRSPRFIHGNVPRHVGVGAGWDDCFTGELDWPRWSRPQDTGGSS
jgi:hypothetical protein